MESYEKLGAFYLGKRIEPGKDDPTEDLILYDSKDLTTHALCVGMTGSGKTGLCVSLLEEAAIDGVPSIIIDPKGDLGNLLLTFPKLSPSEFAPWIDPAEAQRKGKTPEEFAASTAQLWKKGLASWGQSAERVRRLRDSADTTIFTPGSRAGIPLRVLRSFTAPPPALLEDEDAFRERTQTSVSSLLALLGIDADPIRSREHILLSNILDRAWRDGRSLEIADLIREIQAPPFDRIGVLDLESIFPSKDRFELAMSLNNLLASPGFSVWMEGHPLDIGKLLYTEAGRPRMSIISIAHLSDAERMFVVTLVLNEMIAWMRTQPGTSSLRALLYMDEIYGYFPPTQNPPSKRPMLTLLKQARAFGVGVVLSTQNPVDLDYKGLSNCGTWFLGRLQTERDKLRVIDGLEGASAAAGQTFDRGEMDALLSGLGKRVFLMNNVHDREPVLFHTRWAMSYLRGPLTRSQIQTLMAEKKSAHAATMKALPGGATGRMPAAAQGSGGGSAGTAGRGRASQPAPNSESLRPILHADILELFLPWVGTPPQRGELIYRPGLVGRTRLHYVVARDGIDMWRDIDTWTSLDDPVPRDPWGDAESRTTSLNTRAEPDAFGEFLDLPSDAMKLKVHKTWKTALRNSLYRSEKLPIFRSASLKLSSQPGETEGDFRVRITQAARESRDLALEKLRVKYTKKFTSVRTKIERAEQKIEKEEGQLKQQKFQTLISVGTTLLGAFFGRKLASARTVGRASTAARGMGRVSRERGDIERAQDSLAGLEELLQELEDQFKDDSAALAERYDPQSIELTVKELSPRKADIVVEYVALLWMPWKAIGGGRIEPAYDLD